MKVLSIALIAVLFVSAISADSGPMTQVMRQIFESLLKASEESTPGWDSSASILENTIGQVNILLQGGSIPGSESDVSVKDSLVNEFYHAFNSLEDYDSEKTIVENVNVIVTGFTDMFFHTFGVRDHIPKSQIQQVIIENVLNSLKGIKVSGFDVQKSLDEATLVVVKAVLDGYRAECTTSLPTDECITAGTVNALNLLGFNPTATFDGNLSDFFGNIFKNLSF